ncbi:MAG: pantetheine-phosphate adenylyltransferase [Candidatus Latescibacteria bacterium]|nr:pantetheine-phosphate adenylyltransferase [Candidatus Latescibacterota bacterium]
MKKAVYAASFDPVTNGHLWLIKQAAGLFDELIVAIGINPDKTYTFSFDERIELLKETTSHIENALVASFENQFLVNYARSVQAEYIIRGIRTQTDYEFERRMRYINSDLDDSVATIFLMPPREIAEISSSFIKGLIGPTDWQNVVKRYVPEPVFKKFLERFDT